MSRTPVALAVSPVEESSASKECFSAAWEHFEALVTWAEGNEGTLSEVEQGVEQRGRQVLRAVIQGHLDLRAAREEMLPGVEGSDEVRRTHRRSGETRPIGTLFGEIKATRIRHETREKSASSLCPLDGELNLPAQKYSHQVAKRLAHSATMGSFESTIETLEQTSGISVPKRQVEQLVQNAAVDFDAFYVQRPIDRIRECWTDETITVLTTDAKGIHVYLLNHKHYLRYDRYLAAGFPVSSGVIEGTVRHLVNDRMAITGAHWRLPSAEAVLRLRALRCSGDFDAYWAFHERCELQRNHLSKYSGEKLPPTSPPAQDQARRPNLRLVS